MQSPARTLDTRSIGGRGMKTKTYSKLQILEAGEKLIRLLQAEGFEVEYLTATNCVLEDLINILEGRLKPVVSNEIIILREHGFVPMVGQIVGDDELGNRIEWFGEADNAQDDS
jgi:hypothetical protein